MCCSCLWWKCVLVSNGKYINGEYFKVIDKNVVKIFVLLYDDYNGCRYKVSFCKIGMVIESGLFEMVF